MTVPSSAVIFPISSHLISSHLISSQLISSHPSYLQHTIEEKVIERAYKKLALDALVIQQGRLAEQKGERIVEEKGGRNGSPWAYHLVGPEGSATVLSSPFLSFLLLYLPSKALSNAIASATGFAAAAYAV